MLKIKSNQIHYFHQCPSLANNNSLSLMSLATPDGNFLGRFVVGWLFETVFQSISGCLPKRGKKK